jgi:hypothetical protein
VNDAPGYSFTKETVMVALAGMIVTGMTLPKRIFRINVAARKPSALIREIAAGNALGELVKGYLTPAQSATIATNFEKSSALRLRANGVAGQTVGVDQYRASPEEYVAKALQAREPVDRLFVGAINVPTHLRADVQRLMPAGVAVRPAMYNGVPFNSVRAIRWTDKGMHALKLHDDVAQLKDPIQAEFETARIEWPVAFNVYPAVSEGGELEVYNIAPDDTTRARLGIALTGYPYPPELLEPFDKLLIKPEMGDLLILSGRFVHGVRGVTGRGCRILLNHFGGFIDCANFVTWS